MQLHRTARRLPVAVAAVVATISLAGCMYTDADMAASATSAAGPFVEGQQMESAAYALRAPERLAVRSAVQPIQDATQMRHSDSDVEFVRAALDHYRLTARLAELMKKQSRLGEGYQAMADRLLAEQAGRVSALEGVLTAWGEPLEAYEPPVDGAPPRRSSGEVNLELLDRQTDAMGFGPFWLLAVQAEQDDFMEVVDQAGRDVTAPAAKRIASEFRAAFDVIDAGLIELGA